MEGAKLANGKKTERTDSKPRRLLGKRPERKTKAEKLRPGLLPSPAPANLPHGGVLRENPPDLAIGRGLPSLQFQQCSGHRRFLHAFIRMT